MLRELAADRQLHVEASWQPERTDRLLLVGGVPGTLAKLGVLLWLAGPACVPHDLLASVGTLQHVKSNVTQKQLIISFVYSICIHIVDI